MKIRLLIKGDAIQCGEDVFYCPYRTVNVNIADNLIDKEHEHIISVEVEPQESEDKDADKKCTYKETGCGSCKRQLDCPIEADTAERTDT